MVFYLTHCDKQNEERRGSTPPSFSYYSISIKVVQIAKYENYIMNNFPSRIDSSKIENHRKSKII